MLVSTIKSSQQKIGLLELDVAPVMATELGLDISIQENVEFIQTLFDQMGEVASKHLTGLIIDPIYSFSASQHSGKAGCLTRINVLAEEVDPFSIPSLIPDYGLEEISNNYSLAKFDLYYHPSEVNSLKKKQLLAEIHDYCDYLDMNLFLKLNLFHPKGIQYETEDFQNDQLIAVRELSRTTDLIALQFPLEPLAIATLTAELDIPWILIDDGQSYEQYKQELRICLENGASGFVANKTLWQEIFSMKDKGGNLDLPAIEQFIETTFQDRVIELMRIANDNSDN